MKETQGSPAGDSQRSSARASGNAATGSTTVNTAVRLWDLRFRDAALEHDYQRSYFDNDLDKTRLGLCFGALLVLCFVTLGSQYLQTPPLLMKVRLLVVLPTMILCLVATFKIRKHLHALIIGGSVLATVSQIAVLAVLGVEAVANISMAFLQYILFITVLLFQPFRYLVFPVLVLAVVMAFTLHNLTSASAYSDQIANYEMASISVSIMALFFTYIREFSQRKLVCCGHASGASAS